MSAITGIIAGLGSGGAAGAATGAAVSGASGGIGGALGTGLSGLSSAQSLVGGLDALSGGALTSASKAMTHFQAGNTLQGAGNLFQAGMQFRGARDNLMQNILNNRKPRNNSQFGSR